MIKKILPLLLLLAGPAAAQRTELIGRGGLGLFRFGGNNAQGTSSINYSYGPSGPSGPGGGYTNSPYGSDWGTGFGVGGRVQRVTRHRALLAFDLGYDWLRSRTTITGLSYIYSSSSQQYDAVGTTYLRTNSLTAYLGLGYRVQLPLVALDILAGPELAAMLSTRERGSGTYASSTGPLAWATDADRGSDLPVDARLRADLTAWHQRVGLLASYSHGLLNYQGGLIGGPVRSAYGRVLRLGLAYRLR